MITNKGKSIIGKYMLGQAPAYASYIAIGCGARPLDDLEAYGDYSTKNVLDFEMLRVPISSRGFINEDGNDKIVLTAELPTEERYEITEVGLFSAASNSFAGSYDSKTIFSFVQTEGWQYHTSLAATAIETISSPLDENDDNVISTTNKVFQTNANNNIFFKTPRSTRYERCRFLNNVVLIRGDDADLLIDIDGHLDPQLGSNHIHLTGTTVDFSKNAPTDLLKLAFSIVSKNGDSTSVPDEIRILVDFSATDEGSGEYARFEAILENGTGLGQYDFESNRYYVVSKELQELYISSLFTWNAVTTIKIYATAVVADSPSDDYYIALDAIRLDNVSSENPIYGLTGYSVIKNDNAETVLKSPNTSNYVEFRFGIGVS
jgi:hypothetical protein